MTNQQHPITPPYELIEEWIEQFKGDHPIYIATQAAQWGADQELEACCELLWQWGYNEISPRLNRIRRPEPPSLKAQALQELKTACKTYDLSLVNLDTIRRALEQLPDHK